MTRTARKMRRAAAGTGSFDPLSIGWHAAFWADGPAFQALALADGAAVSSWPDETGNGRHATQADAAKRPLFDASVPEMGGQPAVKFDRVDDFLATASWAALGQRNDIVIVARVPSFPAFSQTYCDGIVIGSRNLVSAAASGANYSMYAGATVSGGVPTTGPEILVAQFDGILSSLRVNGVSVITDNPGAHSLTGLTIGANYLGSNRSSAYIGFIGVHATGLTEQERFDIEAWA